KRAGAADQSLPALADRAGGPPAVRRRRRAGDARRWARRRRAADAARARLACADGPRRELLLPREARPGDRGVEPRDGGGVPRRDARAVPRDAAGAGGAMSGAMTAQRAIPCLFLRGGTSRGPFFHRAD